MNPSTKSFSALVAKRLLLLATVYVFIIVFDTAVFSLLPSVVFIKRPIEKLVIYLLYIIFDQYDIFVRAALIDVRGYEHSVVVTDTAFVDASAYTSFYMHFSFRGGTR